MANSKREINIFLRNQTETLVIIMKKLTGSNSGIMRNCIKEETKSVGAVVIRENDSREM